MILQLRAVVYHFKPQIIKFVSHHERDKAQKREAVDLTSDTRIKSYLDLLYIARNNGLVSFIDVFQLKIILKNDKNI